jgi:hypothetical protein
MAQRGAGGQLTRGVREFIGGIGGIWRDNGVLCIARCVDGSMAAKALWWSNVVKGVHIVAIDQDSPCAVQQHISFETRYLSTSYSKYTCRTVDKEIR